MATVRARAGRTRPASTIQRRRAAAREALVASGVAPAPLLPSYEMTQGGPAERYFLSHALATGLAVYAADRWPTESTFAPGPALLIEGNAAVYDIGHGAVAFVSVSHGWARVSVASESPEHGAEALAVFRAQYPASYAITQADGRVPVTFWMDSRFGPQARLRRVEASPWDPIQANYSAAVRDELASIMAWESGPERDGQLLVWLGEPGTGKTWALRALVSEWSQWAEFHYITDPDAFFVDNPSYMVDVLLADSYETLDIETGDVLTENDPDGKWRILILEDTGELLSAEAKEKYGQGLSRLLNVVDGMIGQGLRVLALVTTNDQLEGFHPAVTRPGRCASLLTFGPLSDTEAQAWTGNPDAKSGTLAELYAQRGTGAAAELATDEDDAEAAEELVAAVNDSHGNTWSSFEALAEDDTVAAIRAVAEDLDKKFELDAGYGCGQTAWNPNTATVLWCVGDGTGNEELEEAEAAFTAIDGVENFEYEAEGMPTGWCDADVVYGGNPYAKACEDQAAARMADIITLASQPLDVPRVL